VKANIKAEQQDRQVIGAERGGREGRIAIRSRSTSGLAGVTFWHRRAPLSRDAFEN